MSNKQYRLLPLIMELVSVLIASFVVFQVCKYLSVQMGYFPFVLVICYIALKVIYHICIMVVGYVMKHIPIIYRRNPVRVLTSSIGTVPSEMNNDVFKKRMELFHYEYQREQQEHAKRKEMEDDAKLAGVLKYTRETFMNLEFEESEVFQLCECVRYFVTYRQPLSKTDINIKKRSNITQTSLKNFAWNIAYQYKIDNATTTVFIINTFTEWFSNSAFNTVKQNLRTTTGRHKIEIDENILSDKQD